MGRQFTVVWKWLNVTLGTWEGGNLLSVFNLNQMSFPSSLQLLVVLDMPSNSM